MSDQRPSTPQYPLQDLESFSRFRRALRKADQIALDDLFEAARQHLNPAVIDQLNVSSFEAVLISMLLEQHKEIQRLRNRLSLLIPAQDDDGLKF
jgi:hypothetical protein